MNDQLYKWHRLVLQDPLHSFNKKGLTEIQIGEKKICIAKTHKGWFACAALCPHAAAPLVNGYTDVKGNIVCPLHSYKFSLENGQNVSGEGYFLRTYPLQEREDGWYVGVPL